MTSSSIQQDFPISLEGKEKDYYYRLVKLRDHYIDQVRMLSAHSLTSTKQAGEELADIGSDNFMRDMDIGLISEEAETIRSIQEAIEHLKKGIYGICLDCEKAIQEERLKAIPYATLCVACQSKSEKEKGFS